MYAFVHLHILVKNFLPVPVNNGDPRDAHPTRCINHFAIQCRDFERFTRSRRVWRASMRERVPLVQIFGFGFVKYVRATDATVL